MIFDSTVGWFINGIGDCIDWAADKIINWGDRPQIDRSRLALAGLIGTLVYLCFMVGR